MNVLPHDVHRLRRGCVQPDGHAAERDGVAGMSPECAARTLRQRWERRFAITEARHHSQCVVADVFEARRAIAALATRLASGVLLVDASRVLRREGGEDCSGSRQ